MFSMFDGGATTRRLPGASQFPWKQLMVVLTLVAIAASAIVLATNLPFSYAPAQPAQIEEVSIGSVPAPLAMEQVAQPVQPAPVVVPAAPVVVDYQVTWTEIKDFDPFTIPVEEGLFNGTSINMGWGATEIPEARAYALKVFPEFKDALAILAAISRDPVDKNIVLLSVFADDLNKGSTTRIAFTIDGGKSWCNRDVLPVPGGDAPYVRVLADGNLVTMYGHDPRPGNHWWSDTADKSILPCS